MSVTRWNLVVSSSTDETLREFLSAHRDREGDLSRFVEEAVQAHILELSATEAKGRNAGRSGEQIENAIHEAIDWGRRI